ncbi:hypothetical protein CPC08DRAFT_814800 [Agrocybe pediades]|nr:hypothetical protein CPC08DRAFT_814800 [Agrocybe pediades]
MVSVQHTRFLQFCIQYTSIGSTASHIDLQALVFYDYSLTWTKEVQFFWRKRFTVSTALYIACRYSMVSNILYLIVLAGKLPKALGCNSGYQICCVLSVMGRAGVVCVLGARTYAIYDRNRFILAFIGPFGCYDCYHGFDPCSLGCLHRSFWAWTKDVSEPLGFSVTLAVLLVVYEVLVSTLTLYRGWQALCIRVDLKHVRSKLEYLVVKEGVLYFSFVSMFTLSALVLLNVAQNGSFVQRLLNALTLPISGMMTARFLLHLREWGHKATYGANRRSWHSVINEFGSCPIREARRHRKNTPYEDV